MFVLDRREPNAGRINTLKVAFVTTAVAAASLAGAGLASAEAPTSLTDCPLLLEGQTNDCVGLLQAALNATNSAYGLALDDDFGPDTRIALLDFQGRNRLPADGNAGPLTLRELARQTESVPTPTSVEAATVTEADVCEAVDLVPDGAGGCVARASGAAASLGRPIGECVAEQFKSDLLKEARKQRGIVGKGVGMSKGLVKDLFRKAGAVVTIPKCHLWDTNE